MSNTFTTHRESVANIWNYISACRVAYSIEWCLRDASNSSYRQEGKLQVYRNKHAFAVIVPQTGISERSQVRSAEFGGGARLRIWPNQSDLA